MADYRSSPHGNVEDVTTHGAGHSHVPHALTSHDHTGNEVRDGRSGGQNSQTHDFLRDADGLPHLQDVST